MKKRTIKFWCNAGHTEEDVTIWIDSSSDENEQIREEFLKWLDNNEQCGWDIVV
jgi:hypothetical protein